MAREIKFRGKSAGVWYSGHFFAYRNTGGGTGAHFIVLQETEDANLKPIQVMPETVGQFTGLYDKNGREIYEGDILRKSSFVDVDDDFTEIYLDRDTIGVVRILPSCGTTICNCIVYETDNPYEEKKMKERIKRAQVVGKRSEVIGNIYDNPELLKGE